ncbi:VP2 [Solenopsis invicta densovirus]|uniref:VP2 n=1 Tax=Solenopsis invicta densovirus TaxID=1414671 RepID=U5TU55_9VIRU|nr:VP2 [Solenopsis invicta densovirus]AGZ03696.1 VP2 [Solenopsis invicta densovirus]
MVWKNIKPEDRPNWHKLNEGQRRYAYEQYKLALVRRGLDIDHDRPDVSESESEAEELPQVSQNSQQSQYDTASEGDQYETADDASDTDTIVPDSFENDMAPPVSMDKSTSGASTSGTSNKGGKGIKRQKTSDSGIAEGGRADDGFSLPGTGAEEQADNGFGSEAPRSLALPRPTLRLNNYVRYYSKFHKFITWGISYQILPEETGDRSYRHISTPFAQVPWDRLYLYLTNSEYATLPLESYVTSVSITIKPRNVRVAFPTNSTSTDLATLNQNKDVSYAVGLRQNLNCVNVQYTKFLDGQSMIPQDWEIDTLVKHQDLNKDLYGKEWALAPPTVPRHQMGIPTPLPTYCMIPYPKQDPEPGYPCFQHFYRDFDADGVSGRAICKQHYKPTMGLIKLQKPQINLQYPALVTTAHVPRQGMTFTNKISNVTVDANNQATEIKEDTGRTTDLRIDTPGEFNLEQLIEKSQILRHGYNGAKHCCTQPSLHVAVQPVPALDTKALGGTSNSSFTDVQGWWEMYCEIEINTNYTAPHPLFNGEHATFKDNLWYHRDHKINPFVSMWDGLLRQG